MMCIQDEFEQFTLTQKQPTSSPATNKYLAVYTQVPFNPVFHENIIRKQCVGCSTTIDGFSVGDTKYLNITSTQIIFQF